MQRWVQQSHMQDDTVRQKATTYVLASDAMIKARRYPCVTVFASFHFVTEVAAFCFNSCGILAVVWDMAGGRDQQTWEAGFRRKLD